MPRVLGALALCALYSLAWQLVRKWGCVFAPGSVHFCAVVYGALVCQCVERGYSGGFMGGWCSAFAVRGVDGCCLGMRWPCPVQLWGCGVGAWECVGFGACDLLAHVCRQNNSSSVSNLEESSKPLLMPV